MGFAGIPHLARRSGAGTRFRVARQRKHIVMTDGRRIVTIPRHDPVNADTMTVLVRAAGLTPEQLRRLL